MGEREIVLPERGGAREGAPSRGPGALAGRTARTAPGCPAGPQLGAPLPDPPARVAQTVSPPTRIPAGLAVDAPAPSTDLFVVDPITRLDTLEAVAKAVAACRKCGLGQTRMNSVPGEGDPQAGFVCVGEAPGATED